MANGLEVGLLNYFSVIFPALLVFAIVYAILEKTKMLGESKSVHAIIAIVAAFLVMLSKDVISIISFGAPWFVLVFVFLVLLIMIYRFMGASEADLTNVIKTDKPIQWVIFIVGITIVIASISHVYGQRLLEQTTEDNLTIAEEGEGISYQSELYDTIFNPKILGLILIFLIATFTVALITTDKV